MLDTGESTQKEKVCRKAGGTACLAGPATGRMGKKDVKQLFFSYHSYSRFQKERQIGPLPTLWHFSIGLKEKKIKPFIYISYYTVNWLLH